MASLSSAIQRMDSPTARVALSALGTAALTTGVILSTQRLLRSRRRQQLRDSIERNLAQTTDEEEFIDFSLPPTATRTPAPAEKTSPSKRRKPTSEVIIREALARNYVFFGDEGMRRVRGSFVVVVGVGGVGSAAATMLVRSGVRKVRIIDFDQVSLSSLNRHATATLAQVGTPKVISCKDSFESFAPWVEVDARIELFNKHTAEELLEGEPDYVIDAIDNLESKVDLLVYCKKRGIPVFSSLGAASKSDASRIQISDISTTYEDPLARAVRGKLKREGILSGIPVVYSTEKPRKEIALIPLAEEEYAKGKVNELSAMNNFRVRILPVLGPIPAMFGNAIAAYVLQALAGFPQEPLPVKSSTKLAGVLIRHLGSLEQRLTGSNKLELNETDVIYIYDEVHRGRAVAPLRKVTQNPRLVRWKRDRGTEPANVVVMDKEEALKHEEEVLVGGKDPRTVWGKEVATLVEERFAEERRLRGYRQ